MNWNSSAVYRISQTSGVVGFWRQCFLECCPEQWWCRMPETLYGFLINKWGTYETNSGEEWIVEAFCLEEYHKKLSPKKWSLALIIRYLLWNKVIFLLFVIYLLAVLFIFLLSFLFQLYTFPLRILKYFSCSRILMLKIQDVKQHLTTFYGLMENVCLRVWSINE